MKQQTHAAKILDAAAALIDARGLKKHDRGHDDGGRKGHCALGAIDRAIGITSYDVMDVNKSPAWQLAVQALASGAIGWLAGDAIWTVAAWNNAGNRTQDEVTSTMRAVAMTLRAAATESVERSQQVAEVSAGISELMGQTE